MTDRTRILTVVLDRDYRDDDVQSIVDAVKMIKGVISVDINVSDIEEYMAVETAKRELKDKIYKALE